MGYYRQHTTQKTTNKDNTLMKNNNTFKPTPTPTMMRSYLIYPSILGVLMAGPQLFGFVVTGQLAWLGTTVAWLLAALAISCFFYLGALLLLRQLIKRGYYKIAATIFVYLSPWTFTKEWDELVERMEEDVEKNPLQSRLEREIFAYRENPQKFFETAFKNIKTYAQGK